MRKSSVSVAKQLPFRPGGHKLPGPGNRSYARTICMGLLLVAGGAAQAVWADAAWQADMLGQPVVWQQGGAAVAAPGLTARRTRADFKAEQVSRPARNAADWVVDSADNLGMPFMIVDKAAARVFMFDASGQLSGAASALLGLAVGDDSVPGIGDRALSSIRPEDRTTPAGRYVASLGRNLAGEEILWIDYQQAISLHRVVTSNARERRAARLASPLVADKRISYGCINVAAGFFERVVMPAFTGSSGVVYILPETRDNRAVFGSYYEVDPE